MVSLELYNNRLVGTIPPSLGMLTGLQMLYLYGNQLVGTIPSSLGQMTALEALYLDSNSLTGTIPSTLRQLTNLRTLRLLNNQLTGTIPVLNQGSLGDINLVENYLTMGSLEAVPLSTFSAWALSATSLFLQKNCLEFRNPSNPFQNTNATHCRGEQSSFPKQCHKIIL